MRDLNYQLKQLCHRNRDGSYTTQAKRMHQLMLIANQLVAFGFRGMNARSLKPKPVDALVKDGAEVHIITGAKHDSTIEDDLARAGIRFTHYFSIVEHLEANGETIEWRDGLPYADEDKWNSAKSEYCEKAGIDFMFDASPVYLESFHDIDTTYLQ